MIPADLTARLRLLSEASFFSKEPREVGALKNAQAVSEDLPDFLPGDRILASLREAKSANTFRALIDGREYTLTLPRNTARSGQTLDLVVTHASPKALVATVAEPGTAAVATNLSQTGRMISFLLTGQPTPPPAPLAGGQPLLPTVPQSASQLATQIAPVLRQAVAESGLFYEAQLARWLSGAVSTESLLKQPQSLLTRGRPTGLIGLAPGGSPAPAAGTNAPAAAAGTPAGGPSPPAPTSASPSATTAAALGQEAEEVRAANQGVATQRHAGQNPSQAVPERLMPLVHQQLDALATNNYAWQGNIWPGQQLALEIEEPDERNGDGSDDDGTAWKTTLRLALPRLGGIEARLSLAAGRVRLDLTASDQGTADSLEAARQDLQDALAAVELTLERLRITAPSSEDAGS